MNAIRNFFLRATHWQVFLVLFGLFFLGNAVALRSMIQSPEKILAGVLPLFVLTELLAVCLALWLWSLGAFLNSLVAMPLQPKLAFFRFAIVYPPLYMPVFIMCFQDAWLNPFLLLAVFPLHFLAMYCLIYDLYFVSKSLVLVEKQGPVSYRDYLGYFCALWIFFVGIWIIQPRINRLYAAGSPAATGTAITPPTD